MWPASATEGQLVHEFDGYKICGESNKWNLDLAGGMRRTWKIVGKKLQGN